MRTFCVSNGELVLTNPPHRRCRYCGQVMTVGEETPYCKKVDAEDKENVQ